MFIAGLMNSLSDEAKGAKPEEEEGRDFKLLGGQR